MKLVLISLLSLVLTGCLSTTGVDPKRLDTVNKQLIDKAASLNAAVTLARDLTQRGVLTAAQAREVHARLQTALNILRTAQDVMETTGDPTQVEGQMARIDAIIAVALELLSRHAGGTAYKPPLEIPYVIA